MKAIHSIELNAWCSKKKKQTRNKKQNVINKKSVDLCLNLACERAHAFNWTYPVIINNVAKHIFIESKARSRFAKNEGVGRLVCFVLPLPLHCLIGPVRSFVILGATVKPYTHSFHTRNRKHLQLVSYLDVIRPLINSLFIHSNSTTPVFSYTPVVCYIVQCIYKPQKIWLRRVRQKAQVLNVHLRFDGATTSLLLYKKKTIFRNINTCIGFRFAQASNFKG